MDGQIQAPEQQLTHPHEIALPEDDTIRTFIQQRYADIKLARDVLRAKQRRQRLSSHDHLARITL